MAEMTGPRLYSCCNCRNHVALHDDVISKAFQGRNGRAFLFSHAMNISLGPKEDRRLMTGLHTVADVFCSDCHEELGWKYEKAYDETQKYKEGKIILEKSKIVKENWEYRRCKSEGTDNEIVELEKSNILLMGPTGSEMVVPEVNQELLKELKEMGFPKGRTIWALHYSEIAEFFFIDTTPFQDKYFTDPGDEVYDWRGVLPRYICRVFFGL